MSLAHEFYAQFAAEERMAELRGEAQARRLARAAAGRCPPAHRLRLLAMRFTSVSRQGSRQASRRLAPGNPAPGNPTPRARKPQPCGC